MPEHGNAHDLAGIAGAEDDDQPNSILARAVTEELRFAQAFLASLPDARAPWADAYERFADEHSLTPDLRRLVKTTVLRIRLFGVAARFQPRPRRRRC